MRHPARFLAVTLAGVALGALAACTDPTTAPRPGAGPAALDLTPATSASCATAPVQALTVTSTSLTLLAGQTATFQACTQYESAYTAVSADPTVATVVPTGPAARSAEGQPLVQTFTVTAVAPGQTTITVTDRKGTTQAVTVTVTAPVPSGVLIFNPPSTADAPLIVNTFPGAISLSVSEANYTGTFVIIGCTPGAGAQSCVVTPLSVSPNRAVCSSSALFGSPFGYVSSTDGRTFTVGASSYLGGMYPVTYSCTFTFWDELRNSATYAVTFTST